MSCLGGRARSWAYGRRLTDATCSGTYAEFKEELRQAFEPPENEFRSRKRRESLLRQLTHRTRSPLSRSKP
ncbi:hypothetical protein C6341_g18222 [Phytophthora cactorum]|nr:hypothetical protein C6341_g18222 [Phytophthora cactorum]